MGWNSTDSSVFGGRLALSLVCHGSAFVKLWPNLVANLDQGFHLREDQKDTVDGPRFRVLEVFPFEMGKPYFLSWTQANRDDNGFG